MHSIILELVGPDVKNVKVGQRVALEPGASCRICDSCKAGVYEVNYTVSFLLSAIQSV